MNRHVIPEAATAPSEVFPREAPQSRSIFLLQLTSTASRQLSTQTQNREHFEKKHIEREAIRTAT
jgi:hypothetical protein